MHQIHHRLRRTLGSSRQSLVGLEWTSASGTKERQDERLPRVPQTFAPPVPEAVKHLTALYNLGSGN